MKTILRFIGAAIRLVVANAFVATVPAVVSVLPTPGTVSVLTQISVTFSEAVLNVSPRRLRTVSTGFGWCQRLNG